jgi:hypothetical protein
MQVVHDHDRQSAGECDNARDLRYSWDGASLEILAIRKLLYDAGGNGNRAKKDCAST